jgi:hypothetical protein
MTSQEVARGAPLACQRELAATPGGPGQPAATNKGYGATRVIRGACAASSKRMSPQAHADILDCILSWPLAARTSTHTTQRIHLSTAQHLLAHPCALRTVRRVWVQCRGGYSEFQGVKGWARPSQPRPRNLCPRRCGKALETDLWMRKSKRRRTLALEPSRNALH